MNLLLALLRRFLTLGAGEDADDAADDPPDTSIDDLIDDADEPSKEAATEEKPDKPAPRNRERELEADLERERARSRDLEERYAPRQRAAADPDAESDAKQLADAEKAGWSQDQIYWLRAQQKTAAQAREANRNSQSALSEARSIADKTSFERLQTTKPGVYKRYADRVEKMYAEQMQNGRPVNRDVILKLLIGDDALKGEIKPKTKAAPDSGTKVDRGRAPGVRSDVNGKGGGKNERDARRERLRNQHI